MARCSFAASCCAVTESCALNGAQERKGLLKEPDPEIMQAEADHAIIPTTTGFVGNAKIPLQI